MRKGCLEEVRPNQDLKQEQELANRLRRDMMVWGCSLHTGPRARRMALSAVDQLCLQVAAALDLRCRVAGWKQSPDPEGS